MEITKETIEVFGHGHAVVGTSPTKLVTYSVAALKGVLLRCPGSADPSGNTDPVWVGNGPNVTANSNVQNGGMPLLPGSAMFIPLDDPSKLWVISTAVDQDIAWMIV